MSDFPATERAVLEVIASDGSRRLVPVTESPFLIGRGSDTGNHLSLSDPRISRSCAAIISELDGWYLEDRGHRRGIFVDGKKVEHSILHTGDVITFGFNDSYQIIFRSSASETTVQGLLTRMGSLPGDDSTSGGLRKLNVLLQATSLLHSSLPLESVLGTMLDHAIAITKADRGLLLEADFSGSLRVRLARGNGGLPLPTESVIPSQTALRQALEQRSSVITEDLNQAEIALQMAQSIVAQSLRAVVAMPLYASNPRSNSIEPATQVERGHLLGVVYLDSRRPTAFSKLDREILDALAMESASILDNAHLMERERQRQRLEQEINIARDIQQALIPQGFRDSPYFAATGVHTPCQAVGGDYFDIFPLGEDSTAILVADVSGKGLGAALLTTMLQGAFSGMTVGTDPVQVFGNINRFLCAHSEVGHYATMFFGILHASGKLVCISAGHPSPLLLRGGEVTQLIAEGSFPVGLIPEADYAAATKNLQHGDTLVLFSDGITEAMNPQEELFGLSRLRDTLSGQDDAPLEHIQGTVLRSVQNFARGASQADDITLLLVRYRAAAVRAAS